MRRPAPRAVFVTGATGYLGRPLVVGDALRAESFAADVAPADTLVHLVGTPRPSPAKAAEFRAVDLPSIRASVAAALAAGIRYLVYVSVAQPAPVMQAYIAVRQEGERLIRESGLAATILRPWYVLGPGHRWPYLLLPMYALLSRLPSTRDGAQRLGLVTHEQMLRPLVRAVEDPPVDVRLIGVPEIRGIAVAELRRAPSS